MSQMIVVGSRRRVKDFLFADIEANISDRSWNVGRSMWSAREFGQSFLEFEQPTPEHCGSRQQSDAGRTENRDRFSDRF